MKTAEPLWAGLLLASLLLTSMAFAQPPVSEEELSAEFLEFLGEFETEEGEWIDPEEIPDSEESDSSLDEDKNEDTESKS